MNWQNVDYDATELLRSKGYSIPDYVTYAAEKSEEEREAEEIERIKEELSSQVLKKE
jgi:hypothetical protein